MLQNYRIYINHNTLSISESPNNDDFNVQIIDSQNFDFPTFFKIQNEQRGTHFFIQVKDAENFLARVKSQVSVVEAAGGLVVNPAGDYLFIFRNGKWDLPKGKIESAEEIETAAVREVEEECGVVVSKVLSALQPTFHVYVQNNALILKPTYWFTMQVDTISELTPQIEEGITEVAWVNPKDVANKASNTYPAIVEVLKQGNLL